MKNTVELTPKDCLYIDDTMSQMCAMKENICEIKEAATKKEITNHIQKIENMLCTNYDAMKTLLERALEK